MGESEVKAGQWRNAGDRGIYRVNFPVSNGCVTHQWLGDLVEYTLSATSRLYSAPLATPREVLDAKLATLTPEQRARVTIEFVEGYGYLYVDGVCVDQASAAWWARSDADVPGYLIDVGIDSKLSRLDAALAKPVPANPLTRTRRILAHCEGLPGVTVEQLDVDHACEVCVNGSLIAVWCSDCDDDPDLEDDQTAEAIIARIDAALSRPAPASTRPLETWRAKPAAYDGAFVGVDMATPAQDASVRDTSGDPRTLLESLAAARASVTPAQAVEAATTVFDGERDDSAGDATKTCSDCPIGGREGPGPVCKNVDACDRECRDQLDAMDAERKAFREEHVRERAEIKAEVIALGHDPSEKLSVVLGSVRKRDADLRAERDRLRARITEIADELLGLQVPGTTAIAMLDAIDKQAHAWRIARSQMEAERDRWQARVKLLESRIDNVRDVVGGSTPVADDARGDWRRLGKSASRALATFGAQSQITKVVEECAELITAVAHYSDNKITRAELADEVAGVVITSLQMTLMVGDDWAPALTRQLDKLDAHIEKAGSRE